MNNMFFIYLTKSSRGLYDIFSIISLLLVFALVIFLAYVGAKFIARYQNNVLNSRSNIKVIESFRLGSNKFIAIIKIAEDYFAVGVGKDEITMLDKINPDDLKSFEDMRDGKKLDFKEILSQIKAKDSKDKNEK